MIQSEAQLEQQFLEKLQEMKYTYRSDIRNLDALEKNFRQKFERLNFVSLSDDEFRKLLQENITSDVFTASKRLREKQTFTRNDLRLQPREPSRLVQERLRGGEPAHY